MFGINLFPGTSATTARNCAMETVTLVRSELGPLLDRLIVQLEQEGNLTYRAHFSRIRSRQLRCDWGVTHIIDLSSANAMGFQFSSSADILVPRILLKSQRLIRQLNGLDQPKH